MVGTYTLSEISIAIQSILESNFEDTLSIKAEVASISSTIKGHVYFEFVEKSGNSILAKMKGAMWKSFANHNLNHFKHVNGRSIRAGDELLFMAKVNFHLVYGLSLVVDEIDAEFTLGKREQEKKEILKRLEHEGLLEENKKLEFDEPVKSLAIISSKTAAGYQDLITHLKQNKYGYIYNIQLFQSLMQGETAPQSIVNAFENVNKNSHLFQAVILTRGGGADLDLDCFSTYEVCKAMANCNLPIITGIGHERDSTLADLCAHTHIKTPTAVADFIINKSLENENALNTVFASITNNSLEFLKLRKIEIQNILKELLSMTKDKGAKQRGTLQNLVFQIANNSGHLLINKKNVFLGIQAKVLEKSKNKIYDDIKNIENTIKNIIEKSKLRLKENSLAIKNYDTQLELSSPKKILKRGFAYIKKDNTIITRGKSLKKKDKISIHFLDTNTNAEIK